MSVYISVNSAEPSFLASNEGWREFSSAVPDDAEELAILTEYGWSQEPDKLRQELSSFRSDNTDVQATATELLESIPDGAEVVTVNNGLSPAEESTPAKSLFKSLTRPVKPPKVGTCKIGERSDLTGCIPASGERGEKKPQATSYQADADKQAPETLKKAAGLTGKVKAVFDSAKAKLVGMYKDLEAKHGRTGAILIFAAGHTIGLATPGVNLLPGSTFLCTAAFAFAYEHTKRGLKLATGRKSLDVEQEARRLFAELREEIEQALNPETTSR